MPSPFRSFTTTASPGAAYAYRADFRNSEEWDPGTQTCERVGGDGGIGTTYRNVSRFLGREVEVMYTTAELAPPNRVHLRGTSDQFEGHDIFEIAASGRAGGQLHRGDVVRGARPPRDAGRGCVPAVARRDRRRPAAHLPGPPGIRVVLIT